MSVSIIAAVGKNREIGRNGRLPWSLPGDLRYFKDVTMGHPVLVGRKTLESFPGGKPLPGRIHYVLTQNPTFFESKNVKVVADIDKFLKEHGDEEVFVIGGGSVYELMLPYADKLYLTEVDAEILDADTYFPAFDKNSYNRVEVGKGEDNGIAYTFVRYDKK